MFGGYVNRLMEIRDRLYCRLCRQTMTPNTRYAKNLAAYHVTVAGCPNRAPGHDLDVYLSHCWGCESIIDSRTGPIRVEQLYLCLQCGSGPQRSDSFTQGDICPKCGNDERMVSGKRGGRCVMCHKCGHEIRLPPARRLTGPRAEWRASAYASGD